MKKLLFLSLISLLFNPIFAQDATPSEPMRSKKGYVITPEVGDYAIGINAAPFLEYFGNMLNDSGNDAPSFGFTAQRPGFIYGKYFVSEETAYRVGLRLGYTSTTDREENTIDDTKIDKVTISAANLGVSFGIEKNKSIRGRLRGFYGAEAGVFSSPYTDEINGEVFVGNLKYVDGNTTANNFKVKGGSTIAIRVAGFVGVEYFFAPKISVGGEFGWGPTYSMSSDRVRQPETGDEITLEKGDRTFSLENSTSGSLMLHLYF